MALASNGNKQDMTNVQSMDQISLQLCSQEEQMGRTFLEDSGRQYNTLMAAAQETLAKGLKEKDVQLKRAVRCAAQLKNRIFQERRERAVWTQHYLDLQDDVLDLEDQLREAKAARGEGSGESDYVSSVVYNINDQKRSLKGMCRECGEKKAVVVLLACLHLCLCKECNIKTVSPVICRICHTSGTGFFEVLLS